MVHKSYINKGVGRKEERKEGRKEERKGGREERREANWLG